jgi:hypothetical protein
VADGVADFEVIVVLSDNQFGLLACCFQPAR